jgi:hypothetical protein
MNASKCKNFQDAVDAFYETIPGSEQEKTALWKWRNLCETEREEQIPLSAYLRRKRQTKALRRKTSHRKNR